MRTGKFICFVAFFLSPFLILRYKDITISDYLFFFAWIIAINLKGNSSKFNRKYLLLSMAVLISLILATIFSSEKILSFIVFLKFIVLLIFIPKNILIYIKSKQDFVLLLKVYLFGLIIFATYQVYTYLLNYSNSIYAISRFSGLAEHVTDSAGIILVALILQLVTLNLSNSIYIDILKIAIIITALVVTGSVSAYISATIGLTVFYLRSNKKGTKRKLSILVILALIYFSIYNLINYPILQRISIATSGRYDTEYSRILNWQASLNYSTTNVKTLVIGHGLENSANMITSPNGEYLAPHNMLLLALTSGGIFLTITLSAILFYTLRTSLRRNKYLNVDFFPLIVAVVLFAFSSPLIYTRYTWLPIILSNFVNGALGDKKPF